MRIELRSVEKRFGRLDVLRGVELEASAGDRIALIGPNGSGKSTLIRAVLGLIECRGRILLDGRPPYEDRVGLAKKLAYVPQVAPQLSASVGEIVDMVAYTRGISRSTIGACTQRLELSLGELERRPFRNLSGGMKQKLLLAIAFAAEPSLMVLDEPTASLDARSRESFFALASSLPESTTMLLCSHRLEELRHLARRVVSLEEGRVVFAGSVQGYLASIENQGRTGSIQRAGGAEAISAPVMAAKGEIDV